MTFGVDSSDLTPGVDPLGRVLKVKVVGDLVSLEVEDRDGGWNGWSGTIAELDDLLSDELSRRVDPCY